MAKKDDARCQETVVHQAQIERVQRKMPPDETLMDLAELFKIFGDSTRIRILYALMEGELCVCDIATLLGMSQSAISHQLRLLKQSKLVRYRREGKTVFYALSDSHVKTVIFQGLEHVEE